MLQFCGISVFCGESPLTLRPNFKSEKGSVTAGGESPLTLRPNFKSEKGSVTAAAAACMPRRGSFVGGKKPPLKGEGNRR